MIRFYECVPDQPVIRSSDYYDDGWLWVYRSSNAGVITRMTDIAEEMVSSGDDYKYENPSFGKMTWCCVTIISYWVCIGIRRKWIFGSSDQAYLWSPKYGGDYDAFMIDAGFEKIPFREIGSAGLKTGDILQSWSHAVLCYETKNGLYMDEMPVLKNGSTGNVVKNLQVLLNYWMCQSGANKPLTVDGVFGQLTEQRLKEYQRIQRLYVDGICGPVTWRDILLS